MTVLTLTPAVRAGVRLDLAARSAAHRVTSVLTARAERTGPDITNEVAPLILIAVIAVAAAVALIAVVGAAAAWIIYCHSYFGPNWWPAVHWPTQSNGWFQLACRRA
ncbi:hypothetical protein H4J02_03255 [Protaetiibacter sp. SSC-01]|uniref:hypothetical protein n=1 Tax=Protaetiibacter sp. SSC-01 TaxID=2759943 RepID=UPI001656B1D8|nr:hypothetical protein [Protaetiibacter sp. SSC-01]QNO38061.1 hypothetical protein H4J02_03255 [Protaetiibacter sp. SSC-01]